MADLDRSQIAKIAAHTRWANEPDRNKATQAARDGLLQRFLDAAGGDPVRAENLRKAHYQRLALASARARRAKKAARAVRVT